MTTDPLEFFRTDFPALFARGLAETKARADDGDAKAKARYEDTCAARGVVRVLFEGDGGGEIWLAVSGGTMRGLDQRPADLPVRMVVAAPADAARAGLEELTSSGLLDNPKAAKRISRSASAQVENLLSGHTIEAHLTLTDLPTDPDEVTLRIGLNLEEPPATPKFTATVSWDDIEDVRAGEMTGQQLFGRVKIKGDASGAMALGMSLMQRRPQR